MMFWIIVIEDDENSSPSFSSANMKDLRIVARGKRYCPPDKGHIVSGMLIKLLPRTDDKTTSWACERVIHSVEDDLRDWAAKSL